MQDIRSVRVFEKCCAYGLEFAEYEMVVNSGNSLHNECVNCFVASDASHWVDLRMKQF